uniref:Uncharacterized protein n=1 Tax=Arundo donax TaxID=35708 RepID=A0A0A9BP60_ARUDO
MCTKKHEVTWMLCFVWHSQDSTDLGGCWGCRRCYLERRLMGGVLRFEMNNCSYLTCHLGMCVISSRSRC